MYRFVVKFTSWCVIMSQRYSALALLGALLATSMMPPLLAAEETFDLSPHLSSGDLTQVAVRLEGGGTLKVAEKDKVRSLEMRVVGELSYHEKLLKHETTVRRSARHYHSSQANITIEKSESKPVLAENHRWVGVQADAGTANLFCPDGPLTRDELELIDVPFNSLLIDGLLPDRAVAKGESWKQSAALMTGLLNLDAVSSTDVESTFRELNDKRRAVVQLSGSVAGAIDGVATEIEIKCQYLVDLERHRIVSLAANIKETRPVGHVGPGLAVVAKLQMTVKPLAESAELADDVLAKHSREPSKSGEKLVYLPPSGDSRLLYDRRWHVIREAPELTVLRYVDKGELVAQCNLVTGATSVGGKKADGKTERGQPVSLGTFQAEIQKALAQNFGRFLEAAEDTTSSGNRILRVIIEGKASDLAIQWNYYRVEAKDGRSATFAFMLEKDLLDRFGAADQALVDGLEFPAAKEQATAANPRIKLNR